MPVPGIVFTIFENGLRLRMSTGHTAEVAPHGFLRIARRQGAHEQDAREDKTTNDDQLTLNGAVSTVLSPRAAALVDVFPDRISAELVVDKSKKSKGVSEELELGDGRLPDNHGRDNQKDILQDTAKSHD